MSRSNEHVHGSRRLRRALALGLSGAALVGLVYFEGRSAQAEASAEASLIEAEQAEGVEDLEAERAAVDDADGDAENDVLGANPVILPPSGATLEGEPVPAAGADARLAMATVADAEAAAAMPVAPPVPVLVAVPDIEGMSLRKAKKELAAVGLKLAVRDAYGEKIPREYWSDYKVRTQRVDAGTEVAPGSTVKVKARMRMQYAMGY